MLLLVATACTKSIIKGSGIVKKIRDQGRACALDKEHIGDSLSIKIEDAGSRLIGQGW